MTPQQEAFVLQKLQAIILADRTEPYKTGEARHIDGAKPPFSQNWDTPSKLAADALRNLGYVPTAGYQWKKGE